MNKILYSLFVFAVFAPLFAGAATFTFTPSSGTFAPGETFSVAVNVVPGASEEITTAKLSLTFPPDVVEVVSFSQAASWMALAQPGYDALDNSAGVLVKTGGFPARVKAATQFGILTLRAKSEGAAALVVASDALLLDTANVDKHAGSSGPSFTIEAPAPKPASEVASDPEPVIVAAKPAEESRTIPEAQEEGEEIEEATTTERAATTTYSGFDEPQLAASAAVGGLWGIGKITWYVLIGLLILMLGGVLAWRFRSRNQ